MKLTVSENRIVAETRAGVSVSATIVLAKVRGRVVPVLVFDKNDKITSSLRARIARAMGPLSMKRGGKIVPLNDNARSAVLDKLNTLPGLPRL